MLTRLTTVTSIFIALISLSLWAAEKHRMHSPDLNHNAMSNAGGQPQESGQATFAALIEIVAMLERDPETDWSSVDIDGLRAHLMDMNHMMLFTGSTTSILDDTQIQFDIRGTEKSIPSIHRMVPAHASFIERSRGWKIKSILNENGATLTIDVDDPTALHRINSLGFYGFMALDSHHQAHHYQMAIGNSH